MSTRADFYVGRCEHAEWIGSVSIHGYPAGLEPDVFTSKTEEHFRSRVAGLAGDPCAGFIAPENGWPWPWETSAITDYAYAYDAAKQQVWCSFEGSAWFLVDMGLPNGGQPRDREGNLMGTGESPVFPRMPKRSVTDIH